MRWTDAVYEGAQDRLRIQGFVSVETKAMKPAASTHLFKVGSSFSRGEVFSCQKTLAERFFFFGAKRALQNYAQKLRSLHSIPQSPTKHRRVQGKAFANGLRLDNASLQLVSECAYPKRRTFAQPSPAPRSCDSNEQQ